MSRRPLPPLFIQASIVLAVAFGILIAVTRAQSG
jgi:hypothetical protein